jgi:hypothetical protein
LAGERSVDGIMQVDGARVHRLRRFHRFRIKAGKIIERSRVRTNCSFLSGGLGYAATTGYYLPALQAEIRSLRFHTISVAPDLLVWRSLASWLSDEIDDEIDVEPPEVGGIIRHLEC